MTNSNDMKTSWCRISKLARFTNSTIKTLISACSFLSTWLFKKREIVYQLILVAGRALTTNFPLALPLLNKLKRRHPWKLAVVFRNLATFANDDWQPDDKIFLFLNVFGKKITVIYVLMTWLLGSNHLQFYVPLDDRANDLLTTTSVTQATSDVYDNNSGSTTAAKIFALFRPDLDLSLRWTQKRPSRSSKPPVDDWSERGLTTVTEDWTTTTTNYNNDLTNLNNSYRLTYLTLYWLLPTNEPTKRKNNTATKLNWNWRVYNVLKKKNDTRQTTTGSGIFLPVP